jgi:hypothetical protein
VLLLLAGLVLANARLMEAVPTEPITIDLVPEKELPPAKDQAIAAASEQTAGDPAPPAKDEAQPEKTAARPPAPAPETPSTAATPSLPRPDSPQQDSFTAPPLYLPLLRGLDSTGGDYTFDSAADSSAKLSRDEIASLRAHLQKCWRPPAGLAAAQKLQAVLRVSLKPDGALSREPLLIKASAAAQGPMLVDAAMKALRQCQPFTFLPADKYEEWKLLDLSFSPVGLAAAEGMPGAATR